MAKDEFELITWHLRDLDNYEEEQREKIKTDIYLLASNLQLEIENLQKELEESRKELEGFKKYILNYCDVLEKNSANIRRKIAKDGAPTQ